MKKFRHSRKLKISIHPLFVILGIILVILGRSSVFFICTISAFFHELGHSVIAEKYGYKMQRIRLMPFGAELHGDTDSFDGNDELYIALAGPCVNFFICIALLGVWWISPRMYGFTYQIFETNLVMGCFNLLPLFPLDGGRVLLYFISKHTTRKVGAKAVKKVTRTFAGTLFMVFLATIFTGINFSFGIMSFMLFFSASSSANEAVYQKISLRELVQSRCVEWVTYSVSETKKLYELRRYHIKNRVALFIVLDNAGREKFRFSELDLERVSVGMSEALELSELNKVLR